MKEHSNSSDSEEDFNINKNKNIDYITKGKEDPLNSLIKEEKKAIEMFNQEIKSISIENKEKGKKKAF